MKASSFGDAAVRDDDSSLCGSSRVPGPLVVGDYVQVSRGKLAGLVGVVTRITDGGNYLLTIDGWPNGVHIVASAGVLEHAEPVGSSVG
jgi:KOW motif-containing protein